MAGISNTGLNAGAQEHIKFYRRPLIKTLLIRGAQMKRATRQKGGRPIEEGPKIITENMPVRT